MNLAAVSKVGSEIVKFGYKTGIIQNAPKILTFAGIGCFVGSTISACKTVPKAQKIISEHKEQRLMIEEATKISIEATGEKYPERNSDIAALYLKTGGKLAKTFAVPFGLFALGTTNVLYSYHLINARYLEAVAACNAISKAFNSYRKRVAEAFGEDIDKELAMGVKRITEKDENGNEVVTYDVIGNGTELSPYLQLFNEHTSDCYISPSKYFASSERATRLATTEENISWLKIQESQLTNRLHREGYLLYNDVRRAIGLKPVGYVIINGVKKKAGTLGWTIYGTGDGRVDFGIYRFGNGSENGYNFKNINYKNGDIILDFNVDGDIAEYIGTQVPYIPEEKKPAHVHHPKDCPFVTPADLHEEYLNSLG